MSTSDDFKPERTSDFQYKFKKCGEGRKFTNTKRELKDLPYQLVAAIDFGSTFSGYAFSSKYEYNLSPLKVSTMSWNAQGNFLSLKTSTCILFQEDETFHSFGFDAEDKYSDLMDKDQNQNWLFFRRFKMHLYKRKAGIPGPQLILSLEAEAAALFCKYLNVSELAVGKGNVAVFKPGSKYMVVDVGGGTIDVTVHEVQDDLKLKELYMATGGEWGGTIVDTAFEEFLADILGKNVMDTFKQKHAVDYLELNRNFESKKRSIASTTELKITFTLPMSLLDTYETLNPEDNITKIIKSMPKYAKDLTWKMDKLRIKADIAKDLFKRSVQSIIHHIIELIKEPQVEHIAAILLVGGYSECPLLQEAIKKQFPQKRLVIPAEASLAVLKGAVVNGHELEAVIERKSRMTYGVGTTCKFEPGKHDEKYKFEDEQGNMLCNYIFCKYVEIGEPISVGLRGNAERYYVLDEDQTELPVTIYISKNPNPKYIFEEECENLGELIISMTDTSRGSNRGVDVEFTFGGAEIEVKAFDIHTGMNHTAYFNFL